MSNLLLRFSNTAKTLRAQRARTWEERGTVSAAAQQRAAITTRESTGRFGPRTTSIHAEWGIPR
jgi:hypothetical protein